MVLIKMAWKVSLKTSQSPEKCELMDLPHGILFSLGRYGILRPSLVWIKKWNSPLRPALPFLASFAGPMFYYILNITRGPIGLTRIPSFRIKACDSWNQVVL